MDNLQTLIAKNLIYMLGGGDLPDTKIPAFEFRRDGWSGKIDIESVLSSNINANKSELTFACTRADEYVYVVFSNGLEDLYYCFVTYDGSDVEQEQTFSLTCNHKTKQFSEMSLFELSVLLYIGEAVKAYIPPPIWLPAKPTKKMVEVLDMLLKHVSIEFQE